MRNSRREFLFRGKDAITGQWEYGDICEEHGGVYLRGRDGQHTVDRETVGQWSGFWDDSGERIFEGDRITVVWRDGNSGATVVWEDGGFMAEVDTDEEIMPLACLLTQSISRTGTVWD